MDDVFILRLNFDTASGRIFPLSIRNALSNADASLVIGSMDRMIEAQAFDTGERGNLTMRNSAYLETLSREVFDLTA